MGRSHYIAQDLDAPFQLAAGLRVLWLLWLSKAILADIIPAQYYAQTDMKWILNPS